MLNHDMRQTILHLHETGNSYRTISRLLKLSRNTVREVLAEGATTLVPFGKKTRLAEKMTLVRALFTRCGGNAVRIQEMLKAEYDIEFPIVH